MPFGYVYRKRVARRIRLKRELRHMIDIQRLTHAARILSEFERTKDMHADETRVEREHLKKALKEATMRRATKSSVWIFPGTS